MEMMVMVAEIRMVVRIMRLVVRRMVRRAVWYAETIAARVFVIAAARQLLCVSVWNAETIYRENGRKENGCVSYTDSTTDLSHPRQYTSSSPRGQKLLALCVSSFLRVCPKKHLDVGADDVHGGRCDRYTNSDRNIKITCGFSSRAQTQRLTSRFTG